MKLQYISKSRKSDDRLDELGDVTNTYLSSPHGFEPYNITIIDLSDSGIWTTNSPREDNLDSEPDLGTIGNMIANDSQNIVLIVLPMNCNYRWDFNGSKYLYRKPLKDKLRWLNNVLVALAENSLELEYVAYKHKGMGVNAESHFHILNIRDFDSIYTAPSSDKSVFVRKPGTHIYFTTINGLDAKGIHDLMVIAGEFEAVEEEAPDWMKEVMMFDDDKLNETIFIQQEIIDKHKDLKKEAEEKLKKNAWYKSALYKARKELVDVVTDILEEMFDQDLSDFDDVGDEDLRIKIGEKTYLIEIKGTSSNIRRGNISQTEQHVQKYIDDEQVSSDDVKGLLIINRFRKTPLKERSEVNQDQIELAKRYGILMITTETLLELFEKKLNEQLSKEKLLKKLENVGLLT